MAKDWERDCNMIHPTWNNNNQQYDISILEIVEQLNYLGFDLANMPIKQFAETVPTDGEWKQGDILYNNNPIIGSPIGWICVESGVPGVWGQFGIIESLSSV